MYPDRKRRNTGNIEERQLQTGKNPGAATGETCLIMRLENKVAIVTGGGKGIGAAICEAYSHEGAKVIIADHRSDRRRRCRPVDPAIGWFGQRRQSRHLG